jgi:hypothetical protein
MGAGPSFLFFDVAWMDKWAAGKHAKAEQAARWWKAEKESSYDYCTRALWTVFQVAVLA